MESEESHDQLHPGGTRHEKKNGTRTNMDGQLRIELLFSSFDQ